MFLDEIKLKEHYIKRKDVIRLINNKLRTVPFIRNFYVRLFGEDLKRALRKYEI